MEHLQPLFLKPRTKITIPGHNKLPFSKRQINNGQTISKKRIGTFNHGYLFYFKINFTKNKKVAGTE